MNWVKKRNLPAVKAIKYNNHPCLEINNLWHALHSTFNLAQNCQVVVNILEEIPDKSSEDFMNAIDKCNNSSTPGPDRLSWSHLKYINNNKACLGKIISIANACFKLGLWLSHFKSSMTIIILKPNKESYDSPKSFWLIVLLNTLGKLIKKVIGKCLQFLLISNDFIHLCQLGGLKQRSTSDASVALTHFIHSGWSKNNITSTLAFNIAQFFLSLNHWLLPLILKKAGCNFRVVQFFSNYLVDRKMWYCWNNFFSPFFNVDIGMGQGSALSPILSVLYISPAFHILEKHLKILKIPFSILSFIDNGLFIA